jgi:hypothetical protein
MDVEKEVLMLMLAIKVARLRTAPVLVSMYLLYLHIFGMVLTKKLTVVLKTKLKASQLYG